MNGFSYLRHDNVHLSAELSQCVHQLFRIFVDSDPAAVHKDLSSTKALKTGIKTKYDSHVSHTVAVPGQFKCNLNIERFIID